MEVSPHRTHNIHPSSTEQVSFSHCCTATCLFVLISHSVNFSYLKFAHCFDGLTFAQLMGLRPLRFACRTELFGEMTKEKLCKLSLLMAEEYYEPSQTIIRQGQPMSSCYIIASGKVGVMIQHFCL